MIVHVLVGTTVGALVTAGLLGWLLWRESRKRDDAETMLKVANKQLEDRIRKAAEIDSKSSHLRVVQ